MQNIIEEFNAYRSKMNERILEDNNKIVKRIFNLDTNAFQAGALDVKTKELLRLFISDSCIDQYQTIPLLNKQ